MPPVVLGFSPCFGGGGGGPSMTVCARQGKYAGYGKRSVGESVGIGRSGVTQSVRRYVRLWRCVGNRASAAVRCVGEGGEAEARCASESSSRGCQKPIKSNCSAFKRRTVWRTGSGMGTDFVVRAALRRRSVYIRATLGAKVGQVRPALQRHHQFPRASQVAAFWLLSNSAPHSLRFPPVHSN